jgi:hypothetical protein
MKNRISESKRKLNIYFKDKVDLLNSNTTIFSKEEFILFKKIILKSYCVGYISESEFMEITLMIGKNINCLNACGFIEKSVIQIFCDIASGEL